MAPISPPSPPKVCMFMGSTTVYDWVIQAILGQKKGGVNPQGGSTILYK